MSRRVRATVMAALWSLIVGVGPTPRVAAVNPPNQQPTADLDGRPIDLHDVGAWFCADFTYPKIHCSSTAKALETSVAPAVSASGLTYIVVYEQPTWGGSYMYISQDYTALAAIGWNDRISSFSPRNGESGHFYTDWFYLGTSWLFCCNSDVTFLGGYDNTFSSIHRG